jgi:hypothetical protein
MSEAHLELRESATANGVDADDDTVKLHVIRPGIGRGRGRHLYEAKMLEENATKFTGWRMYVDHLSPEARKAAGGLPRSIRDLGGRIIEAKWDGDVPADAEKGYGQGAVVATAKPTPFVRELIENDPEIIEASISATATGVKPADKDGQRVWVVEGISPRGSVDWVTEAGAGGKVVSVMESVYEEENAEEEAIFAGMTSEDLTEAIAEARPEVVEALVGADKAAEEAATAAAEQQETVEEAKPAKPAKPTDTDDAKDAGKPESEDSDLQAEITRLEKKGLPKALAVKAAKKNLAEAAEAVEAEERDDAMGITPEQLQEAFESDDFQQRIDALVESRVRGLVESTLSEERDLMHEEARANAGRQIQLRDLRDAAAAQIDEAKLPKEWKTEVKRMFDISEGRPSANLDVVDEIDDDGNVVKSASVILTEAVAAEVDRQRSLLAAAAPTRVTGQGANRKDGETGEKTAKGTGYGSLLEEAGFKAEDLDEVWATA